MAVTAVLAQHSRRVPEPCQRLAGHRQRRIGRGQRPAGDADAGRDARQLVGSGCDRGGHLVVAGQVQQLAQSRHGACLADGECLLR